MGTRRYVEVSLGRIALRTSKWRVQWAPGLVGEGDQKRCLSLSTNICCVTNHPKPRGLTQPSIWVFRPIWAELLHGLTSQLVGQRGTGCFQRASLKCSAVGLWSARPVGVAFISRLAWLIPGRAVGVVPREEAQVCEIS